LDKIEIKESLKQRGLLETIRNFPDIIKEKNIFGLVDSLEMMCFNVEANSNYQVAYEENIVRI
jgi:hypothetical protein